MLKRWTVVVLAAVIGTSLFLGCVQNHPPRFIFYSNTPTTIARNDTVSVICHAIDDDGDSLGFDWTSYGGTWLAPSTDSIIDWIAPALAGSYMVTTVIKDFHGGAITETLNIMVSAPARVSVSIDTTQAVPGAVKLRWTRNGDADFLRYEVFSSETKGFNPGGNPDTMIIDRTDTTWTKTGLLANHTYYFVITVVDNNNNRSPSNEVSTTVISLPPTAITLYPIRYIEPTAVRLFWTQNPDNDFSKYEVFCSTSPNFVPDTLTRVGIFTRRPDTTFLVPGLTPRTVYYFKTIVTNVSALTDTSNELSCSTTGLYQIGSGGHPLRIDLSMPGYAFLATQDGGLRIYSIINPENPFLFGSYIDQDFTWHIFISQSGDTTYSYLADGGAGLAKLNVTNPATPLFVCRLDTGWVHSVAVSNGSAFFGTYYNSVYYFGVSDAPTLTSCHLVPLPDRLSEIFVQGNFAYVADHNGGLCIMDISDTTNPRQIASVLATQNVNNSVNGVYVSGSYAYVAAGALGLVSVDISSPNQPRILMQWPAGTWLGSAQDVYVLGNYAYVADGLGGLVKVNVTNPAAMFIETTYGIPGADIWDTRVSGIGGNHAFTADHNGSIQILSF